MAKPKPIELEPDYYHANFCELTRYVCDQYWDLLSEAEQTYANIFHALSVDAQKLYIRLISRKGPFFRKEKLKYPGISDIATAARELEQGELLHINPSLPMEQLLSLYNKAEVIARMEEPSWKRLSRPAVNAAMIEREEPHDLSQLQGHDEVYEILGQLCLQTFKLCFFGNLHQDLTEWVLRDLGVMRYENYTIDSTTRAFTSREQMEKYLQYYLVLDSFEEGMEADVGAMLHLLNQLPTCEHDDWVLHRRLDRTTYNMARQLERLGALYEALPIYQRCYHPPARERVARIAVKQGRLNDALELCREMEGSPITEAEEIFALEFGYRTARKARTTWPSPSKYKPPTEKIQLFSVDQGVELETANFFSSQGDCYFVENALWNGLLGLSVWDIVFAPIRGAFFHPFQRSPNGFRSPDFIKQRKAMFAKRWASFTNQEKLQQQVISTYEAKLGRVNPFVFWESLSSTILAQALERIPVQDCLAVFQRILSDVRENRTGFPDLVFFPKQGGYELIEVKGPGDRLQKNQLRWLDFFAKHHIPHRVVHVEYTEQAMLPF